MGRRKPYKLKSQELGRGPWSTNSFATLTEAAKAVKEQWQGADYMDGPASFHTDYCLWQCAGFVLADIGTRRFDSECQCWEFDFHKGDEDGND